MQCGCLDAWRTEGWEEFEEFDRQCCGAKSAYPTLRFVRASKGFLFIGLGCGVGGMWPMRVPCHTYQLPGNSYY